VNNTNLHPTVLGRILTLLERAIAKGCSFCRSVCLCVCHTRDPCLRIGPRPFVNSYVVIRVPLKRRKTTFLNRH